MIILRGRMGRGVALGSTFPWLRSGYIGLSTLLLLWPGILLVHLVPEEYSWADPWGQH